MTDYRGKLRPGADASFARSIRSYREADRLGVLKGVELIGCPDCPISAAHAGIYTIDNLPALPLPGCNRSPCCGCDYSPVV